MLKSLAPQQFQQSIVFILKQTPDQAHKDQIIKFVQGGEQGNLLVSYGEKEYSILSALNSERQQTRDAALTSLTDTNFVKILNPKEKSLVSMILMQLLGGTGVEEKQFLQILSALKLFSNISDSEFEVLLNVHDRICEKKIVYSKNAFDRSV